MTEPELNKIYQRDISREYRDLLWATGSLKIVTFVEMDDSFVIVHKDGTKIIIEKFHTEDETYPTDKLKDVF